MSNVNVSYTQPTDLPLSEVAVECCIVIHDGLSFEPSVEPGKVRATFTKDGDSTGQMVLMTAEDCMKLGSMLLKLGKQEKQQ